MTGPDHSSADDEPSNAGSVPASAPPRWVTTALVGGLAFVSVGALVAFSGDDMWIGRLSVALATVWFALFALVLVLAARFRRRRPLIVFGCVSLVLLALGAIGIPMSARAALSESQLAAAAERVQAGESVERAGLYWPTSSWYDEDQQCTFFETQGFVISSYGVAYCAGEVSRLEKISGNVYRWEID